MLSHENLDVYRCATEFVAFAFPIIQETPSGYADLRDQFRRSALSIPLNIAEGAGKTSGPDRAHSYTVARGSAHEYGAILDILVRIDALAENKKDEGERLLVRIVSMLTKLCHKERAER